MESGGGMMAAMMAAASRRRINPMAAALARRRCEIEEDDDESERSDEEEKEGKEVKSHNVKGSVSLNNLSELLLSCNMSGIWPLNLKVLKLIGFFSKSQFLEVSKEKKPSTCEDNIWVTVVILAILNKYYRKKKSEWKLITRKCLKTISKRSDCDEVIENSRQFVNSV